ncbi:Lanthionine synthetase C-like [Parasponia andersonii]|uniref:Lanthionine synthetase C-like n=1 Tax=Parasponia andersonii TaxID=3476 RepID=A0A2P5ABR0_PARAD|nr:Lanthionine synthetase C-like [Parasponia andersonii]
MGKKYVQGSGLARVMHVLMDMELKPDEVEDVKDTLRYRIKNRSPCDNYPSSEGSESDRRVHWCHGAPGPLVCRMESGAAKSELVSVMASVENTYVYLALYQLTGKVEYLCKANAFACFLHDRAERLIFEGRIHGGDPPFSLFEGTGVMAYLFLDMIEPYEPRFPAYELFKFLFV